VLQDQGDLNGAQAAFGRALRIDEAAFGPDHPTVARDLENLGRVLYHRGDVADARDALERALRIYESALGASHRDTQRVRAHLDTAQ
jgi:Tfp pilus assembly protein PilF